MSDRAEARREALEGAMFSLGVLRARKELWRIRLQQAVQETNLHWLLDPVLTDLDSLDTIINHVQEELKCTITEIQNHP